MPASGLLGWIVLVAGACASRAEGARPPAPPVDGIEFDLAVPRDDVFQRALAAFVQFGVPVADASEAAGSVRSGPHRLDAETVVTYGVTVSGSERVTRVALRGRFSAPALGIEREPITPAEHGFRAKPWQHMSQLAHAIESQPSPIVMPVVKVQRPE